jgi:dipeptidyl aminopeptidase/acylaminoacyl peptidase
MRVARCFALVALLVSFAAAEVAYQKPPQEILEVLNAPPAPVASVSPNGEYVLFSQAARYPPIAVLSQPMLRLAGLRINPRTNGPHNPPSFVSLTLKRLADGSERRIALPAGAQVSAPRWSGDGKRFAFTNTGPAGVELWVGDASSGAVRRLPGVVLNAVYGEVFQWMPDHRSLFVRLTPAGRGEPPAEPLVPKGPKVQESYGKGGTIRTYQDLLSSPHDEDLFDYYATCQLALIDSVTARVTPVGKPAIFGVNEPSPDGRYFLVSRIHRPYSYLRTIVTFPRVVEVWDTAGRVVHTLARLPSTEDIPEGGVHPGPRSYNWRPTAPATLVWVQAIDAKAEPKAGARDKVLALKAPFDGQPVEIARTAQRFSSLIWIDHGGLVIVRDYERTRRMATSVLVNADDVSQAPRTLWKRRTEDRYGDPGNPVLKTVAAGQRVAVHHHGKIFLHGAGATPKGDRPFLRTYDLATGAMEEVFRSAEDCYEDFVALIQEDGSRILTRKESPAEPPNYYVRSKGAVRAITAFRDPAPRLREIRKELVTYQRADGVALSFTLYLPPGYQPGTRLPTVMWAYPREYSDADTAGQVVGSPQRFTSIAGPSHLFFLLAGYAILDNAAMPVVGSPQKVNDTYVEQIVMNAKAAIDKAAQLGVTDPERVGVGGHSYGAFMTANLLAHCDLFRAGIARSGAYNRTLTPFGFQNERRTLWQAPELYLKMSPFLYANKINEPILLIHGEADNNSGTFPIQSERMYQAIRGNKGTVRYVTLPHESHSYTARESVEHTLWEMLTWFDKYVKNAPPRPQAASRP